MRNLSNLVRHMRQLRPQWEQRALALAGMVSLTAGMILVSMTPTSAAVTGRGTPPRSGGAPVAAQGLHSPVTVQGPHLYDPDTWPTVTVLASGNGLPVAGS